jgi:hypothetical protein
VSASHFFVVGAQRSGTTHLTHLLASHPEIEMAAPFRPEPKFFLLDDLFARGLSYYEATFFGHKPGARLRGEKTVSYMESDTAARRIADAFPEARIVFLLRDPIERAVSHYWFSVENGVETLPMGEAFRREEEGQRREKWQRLSMSPFSYLRRGCYVDGVARYETVFGRERVRILLYEDLVSDPTCLRDLCRWVGVDNDATPHAPPRDNNLRADQDEAIPRALQDRLVAYFTRPTTDLAERYGLDLSVWTEAWSRPVSGRASIAD